jgi:hypothetical protein
MKEIPFFSVVSRDEPFPMLLITSPAIVLYAYIQNISTKQLDIQIKKLNINKAW